jgi:hypothetical protein
MTAIGTKGLFTVACSAALLTCGVCVAVGGKGDESATAKIFDATWEQTTTAITNAFASHRYHEMALIQQPYQFDRKAQRSSRIPTTNEWGIYTMELPVAEITVGGKRLPYFANFDIRVENLTSNQCKVIVRTTSARIPGGKVPNIHGSGWVVSGKYISPILEEETNVLNQIEWQLNSLPGSTTNTIKLVTNIPSTATPGLNWHEIGQTNPHAREELIRAIQSEPNAGLRGELLKVLERMTNNSPAKSSPTRQP